MEWCRLWPKRNGGAGIHDAGGNLIPRTTNDDGGQGYNSRLTFTATESGTHYIAAGAAGVYFGRGTYVVEVTDTSPPIVAPDPVSEDPPDTQEQVQQQPPAFGSQFYGFELPEDTDGSANRISLGAVSATDPDGGSVTYSIEGGNAAGLFEIDAASGELFYTGGGEDYETGSTSFELTVRASGEARFRGEVKTSPLSSRKGRSCSSTANAALSLHLVPLLCPIPH